MNSLFDQYRQTSVQTASPEQLVIMLYDGMIRFLEQAKLALQEGKEASEPLYRSQQVILELMTALNHDAGEMAENLARLYYFWLEGLLKAQIRRDPAHVEQVITMARDLREAWHAALIPQKRAAAFGGSYAAALNTRG